MKNLHPFKLNLINKNTGELFTSKQSVDMKDFQNDFEKYAFLFSFSELKTTIFEKETLYHGDLFDVYIKGNKIKKKVIFVCEKNIFGFRIINNDNVFKGQIFYTDKYYGHEVMPYGQFIQNNNIQKLFYIGNIFNKEMMRKLSLLTTQDGMEEKEQHILMSNILQIIDNPDVPRMLSDEKVYCNAYVLDERLNLLNLLDENNFNIYFKIQLKINDNWKGDYHDYYYNGYTGTILDSPFKNDKEEMNKLKNNHIDNFELMKSLLSFIVVLDTDGLLKVTSLIDNQTYLLTDILLPFKMDTYTVHLPSENDFYIEECLKIL